MATRLILHICGGAIKSLFAELFKALHLAGVAQQIYVPVRDKIQLNSYDAILTQAIPCSYALLIKPYHRYLYRLKINTLYNYLLKHHSLETVGIVHSHSLFSDGGIALKIHQAFQIPYITTVTNTDMNYFFKYGIHLRQQGLSIAEQASTIVFHNPAYRNAFLNRFYRNTPLRSIIESKSVVIPIGISQKWFDEIRPPLSEIKLPQLHLLYVGDFSKNKRVEQLIKLVTYQQAKGIDWKLTLVGGAVSRTEKIKQVAIGRSYIQLIDWVTDEASLRQLYRQADVFIMLSKYETFGKVYIEALTQGLPIIYTQGQGVDGFFEDNPIGLAVPFDNAIADTIMQINHFIEHYNQRDDITTIFEETLQQFHPNNLLQQWMQLYR